MSQGNKTRTWPASRGAADQSGDPRRSGVLQVCHRAKNDLQTAANLVGLAASTVATPGELAEAVEPRIQALSIPYNLVHETGGPPRLDALARAVLRRAMAGWAPLPRLEVAVEPLELSLRLCSPLGLWLLEAGTNAVRHGIGGGGDLLRVSGGLDGDGFRLEVTDNGPGPEGSADRPEPRLGLRLASLLAANDLRGSMGFTRLSPGLMVSLAMPSEAFEALNRGGWE